MQQVLNWNRTESECIALHNVETGEWCDGQPCPVLLKASQVSLSPTPHPNIIIVPGGLKLNAPVEASSVC